MSYFEIDGELRPLIKSGKYDAVFKGFKTVRMFNGRAEKLELLFDIITHGKYFGINIPRYYNVKIKGKAQTEGCFKAPQSGNFLREYANLFGLPQRLDRIPMSKYKNKIFECSVKTVKTGYNQAKIHKQLQYSVIEELIKVKNL